VTKLLRNTRVRALCHEQFFARRKLRAQYARARARHRAKDAERLGWLAPEDRQERNAVAAAIKRLANLVIAARMRPGDFR